MQRRSGLKENMRIWQKRRSKKPEVQKRKRQALLPSEPSNFERNSPLTIWVDYQILFSAPKGRFPAEPYGGEAGWKNMRIGQNGAARSQKCRSESARPGLPSEPSNSERNSPVTIIVDC
jgi:hypothetical protein